MLTVNNSIIHRLDPALPFFSLAQLHWKLDSSDGYFIAKKQRKFNPIIFLFCRNFVDILHTNAGVYGKLESCGHVDFYLNNGQFQVNYLQQTL